MNTESHLYDIETPHRVRLFQTPGKEADPPILCGMKREGTGPDPPFRLTMVFECTAVISSPARNLRRLFFFSHQRKDHLCTRADPPRAKASTSPSLAMVTSPGKVVRRAPCAHPRWSASSGLRPEISP